ncbi:hypothetical protein ACFOEK_03235 [Litoribrevibacter euphylliae]|uniref:Uncharacterized protein n=1 Tax=Litoribrevibacter euphylliae TaxID=1834034 RepID=A0ABV7H8B6_9GAMM
MSHWVYAPVLRHTETNEHILNLAGNVWDLRSAKESQDTIILQLARYPDGSKDYEIKITPRTETAIVNGTPHPLTKLAEVLDAITPPLAHISVEKFTPNLIRC